MKSHIQVDFLFIIKIRKYIIIKLNSFYHKNIKHKTFLNLMKYTFLGKQCTNLFAMCCFFIDNNIIFIYFLKIHHTRATLYIHKY